MGHRDQVATFNGRGNLGKASRLLLLPQCLGGGADRMLDRKELFGARFIVAFALRGRYIFGTNHEPGIEGSTGAVRRGCGDGARKWRVADREGSR